MELEKYFTQEEINGMPKWNWEDTYRKIIRKKGFCQYTEDLLGNIFPWIWNLGETNYVIGEKTSNILNWTKE